jgi:hypothetical protein
MRVMGRTGASAVVSSRRICSGTWSGATLAALVDRTHVDRTHATVPTSTVPTLTERNDQTRRSNVRPPPRIRRRPPAGSAEGSTAATHRDRHGRQRSLGEGPWPTPHQGHEQGEYSLFDAIEGAIEIGIPYLSAYAFSTENWKRSPDEVRS